MSIFLRPQSRHRKFRTLHRASRAVTFEQFSNTLLAFIGIIALHTITMMLFEDLAFKDALWLTTTTITTVGYGDLSPQTNLGRLSTIVIIYIGGIAVLTKLVAEYIDYRLEQRERKIKGLWEWRNMKEHILIINTPSQDTERYLKRLVDQIKQTPVLAHLPIQIVSDNFPDGLPREVGDQGVVHIHGRAEESGVLEKLNLSSAKYIIIVSRNANDTISDSINFDILHRAQTFKSNAFFLVEVIDDQSRKRFQEHGADSIVRPVRTYPEIITRALEAPGTEQILENLFTHKGDSPQRFKVIIRNMHWKDVASRIIQAGIGIPLGYIDEHRKVITNPEAESQVHGDYLIVLINENKKISDEQLARALSKDA